jgi:hypothetical protein
MENVITPSDTERPAHTTNGSSRREARSVSAQGLIYRLPVEIQSLKADLEHTSGGRAAKTLAKTSIPEIPGPIKQLVRRATNF